MTERGGEREGGRVGEREREGGREREREREGERGRERDREREGGRLLTKLLRLVRCKSLKSQYV